MIEYLFSQYSLKRFTMDRTGLGLPLYQELQDAAPHLADRIVGYNADEKLVIGWEEHGEFDDPSDFEIKRQAKEFGYDLLRTYVDQKRLVLPWDTELLGEFQGSVWTREQSQTNAYGRKLFSKGRFHTLDAAAMAVAGKELYTLETMKTIREQPEDVGIVFV